MYSDQKNNECHGIPFHPYKNKNPFPVAAFQMSRKDFEVKSYDLISDLSIFYEKE